MNFVLDSLKLHRGEFRLETHIVEAIHTLFHPKSIALIGASEKTMYGKGILEYLRMFNYPGKIYPINLKRDEVLGVKAYPSVTAVDDDIDIALVIVGRKFVLSSIKECVEKKVKAIIVITAGFGEADEKGKELESAIIQLAQSSGLRICGPNCAGIANLKDKILMAMLREEGREMLGEGNVGFVSQSGALMMTLTGVARDKHIRLNYIASTGNECDLEVSDFINYYIQDPGTNVITAFIEGFKDAHKFGEIADRATQKSKPIIVLKVGRSDLGQKAAVSHTGHLTGSDTAYEALFTQKNIIRALDTEDLFETAKLFSAGRLPQGDGVAILTSSGGTGSLTADLCGDLGIHLPEIVGETKTALLNTEGLLTFGDIGNPADIRGQGMGIIKKVLPPILNDERFSVILVCLAFSTVGPGLAQNIVPDLMELYQTTDKPMAVLWIGRKQMAGITGRNCGFELLEQNGIPVFDKPATCLRAIKALIDWTQRNRRLKGILPTQVTPKDQKSAALKDYVQGDYRSLTESQSKKVLAAYGIPCTKEGLATTVAEAESIAEATGYPLALKIMSPQIAHKTEAGIIALNIHSKEELGLKFDQITKNAHTYDPSADIHGVLVQEMVTQGTEVILGMSQDPQFGPVIMFGLGGIFVEVMEDVVFGIPPLTRQDAEQMIKKIKGYKILEGIRGGKPADTEALKEVIVNFSQLCSELQNDVSEIDINPLMVFEDGRGVKAIDSLVVLKS
jgi:acetyltransferase